MKHAESYEVVTTKEGVPVFVIDNNRTKPDNAVLLYDGGKHATLFRNDHDVILLDYLPDEVREYIANSTWAVVLEKNKAGDAILKDYKVMIKKVKKNPLTDGLK